MGILRAFLSHLFFGENFTPNHHQRSDTRQSKLFSGLMVAWLVKHRVDFQKINMDWNVTTIGIYWMGVGILLGDVGREASRVEMHKVPHAVWMPKQDFTISCDSEIFRVHYCCEVPGRSLKYCMQLLVSTQESRMQTSNSKHQPYVHTELVLMSSGCGASHHTPPVCAYCTGLLLSMVLSHF